MKKLLLLFCLIAPCCTASAQRYYHYDSTNSGSRCDLVETIGEAGGRIWAGQQPVAGFYNGLDMFENGVWRHFTNAEIGISASNGFVRILNVPGDPDAAWFCTYLSSDTVANGSLAQYQGGLIRYYQGAFARYDQYNVPGFGAPSGFLGGTFVYPTVDKKQPVIWYGYSRRPFAFNVLTHAVQRFDTIPTLRYRGLQYASTDLANNKLYYGSRLTFLSINGADFHKTSYASLGLPDTLAYVDAITQADDSAYYFHAYPHLFRRKHGITQRLDTVYANFPARVSWYATEKNGTLWVGSYRPSKLYRLSRHGQGRYIDGLPYAQPETIYPLFIDSQNNKWHGGSAGAFAAQSFGIYRLEDVDARFLVSDTVVQACITPNLRFYDRSTTIGDGIARLRWRFTAQDSVELGKAEGDTVLFGFSQPGQYRVQLTAIDSNGSRSKYERLITAVGPALPQLFADSTYGDCESRTLSLSPLPANAQVIWTDSAGTENIGTGASLTVYKKGLYKARIQFPGCLYEDTVRVRAHRYRVDVWTHVRGAESGPYINASVPLPLDSVRLQINPGNLLIDWYRWRSERTPLLSDSTIAQPYVKPITIEGMERFSLEAGHKLCTFYGDHTLEIHDVPILPNLITPYHPDRKNDHFVPGLIGGDLRIYDRWGALIYAHDAYEPLFRAWPEPGRPLPLPGIYFVTYNLNGTTYKGWLEVQ